MDEVTTSTLDDLRSHYLSRVGSSAGVYMPEDADLLLLLDKYDRTVIRHALSSTAQRVRTGGCEDPAAYLHGTARRLSVERGGQ